MFFKLYFKAQSTIENNYANHPKKKTTTNLLFDKIICAIVFGSISSLLVLLFSGVEGLVSFLEGITPPDRLIYYFSLLTLLHCVVWAISKYSLSYPILVEHLNTDYIHFHTKLVLT